MTEKQMPAVAVQARPPRDVKASVDAVLETNNNTRMVSGGNIDYNKLIRADNVPSKSGTAAQHSAESKKDATEAKRPQVWKGEMCLRPPACPRVRGVRQSRESITRFTSALAAARRRNHSIRSYHKKEKYREILIRGIVKCLIFNILILTRKGRGLRTLHTTVARGAAVF